MNRAIGMGVVVLAAAATLTLPRSAEATSGMVNIMPGTMLLPAFGTGPGVEYKCLTGDPAGRVTAWEGTDCPSAEGSWTFWHRGYVHLPWSRGTNHQAYAEWDWWTPYGSVDTDWAARLVSYNFDGSLAAAGPFNYGGGNDAGGPAANGATSQSLNNAGDGSLVLEIALRSRQWPRWPFLMWAGVRSYSE